MKTSRQLKAALSKKAQQIIEQESKPKFDFDVYCFPKQRGFFRDIGPKFRTAVTSRRAGKSTGIAADMIDTCLAEEDVNCLYITVTKENARNIIWLVIREIIEKHQIQCKLNDVRMTVTFPNRSRISLGGAKDRGEIEKYRGWKLKKCYIDECQSFRSHILEDLINDIVIPALRDLDGDLYLTGTPGPVRAGVFYQYSHSKKWGTFKWTAFDNPHMHNPPDRDLNTRLTTERELRGIDESDPSYIRETYGEWIEDIDSLVFKFNPNINRYDELPDEKFDYLFGIDVGYNDSDAIAVIAVSRLNKKVYLVEEIVRAKQGISELAADIKRLQKHYEPIKMVMDAGALGKKIQEELRSRHQLSIQAADKHRKVEFIELLNDDLRTGKLQVFEKSVFEDDCMLVQWDKESVIRNPENPKISNSYHSDICDALLYVWREAHHFNNEPVKKSPRQHTEEWMAAQEAKEAQDLLERQTNPDYDLFKQYEKDLDDYGSSEGW